MKVKAIQKYYDMKLQKLVCAGEKFEVTDARGKVLINAGVAQKIAKRKKAK